MLGRRRGVLWLGLLALAGAQEQHANLARLGRAESSQGATVLGLLRAAPGIRRLVPGWPAHLAPREPPPVATALGIPGLVPSWPAEPVIASAEPVTASHEELP